MTMENEDLDQEQHDTENGYGEVYLTEEDAASLVPITLQDYGIEPGDLKYRGEGNYTLVASYERNRQVLRFRKAAEPYEKMSVKKAKLNHSCHLGAAESAAAAAAAAADTSDAENSIAAASDVESSMTDDMTGECCPVPSICSCPISGPHCCRCYHSRLVSIKKLQSRKLKKPPKSLNLTYLYIETVMKHLLGVRFIPPIEVLHVDTESLGRINSQMQPSRPKQRLVKDIDVNYHEVIITSDVAFLPPDMDEFAMPGCSTLCVEIKAKQGFIPVSKLVQGKVRRTWCRFCLMQFHLKKARQYATRSSYCPCDMFSGDKQRMLTSLRSLIETPQINLRVFQDGHLLYHEGSRKEALDSCLREFFATPSASSAAAVDAFVEILYRTLTHELESAASSPAVSMATEFCQSCARQSHQLSDAAASVELQPSRLSPNCVLGRILAVQLLDRLGIDGTLSHYNRLVTFLQENGTAWDCSKGSLKDFVESLNAPLMVTQSAQHYDAYLTSLVAKDCSIMVTLAPSRLPASDLPSSVPHVADPATGRGFLFSLAIVDLDPKPFDKIRLNYKEELEALRRYESAASASEAGQI